MVLEKFLVNLRNGCAMIWLGWTKITLVRLKPIRKAQSRTLTCLQYNFKWNSDRSCKQTTRLLMQTPKIKMEQLLITVGVMARFQLSLASKFFKLLHFKYKTSTVELPHLRHNLTRLATSSLLFLMSLLQIWAGTTVILPHATHCNG